MKKAILTCGLFSLMMILTSFTSPEIGGNGNQASQRLTDIGGNGNQASQRLTDIGGNGNQAAQR